MKNRCGCNCGCNDDCSTEEQGAKRILDVDFLYIDLNECERCKGTDAALEEALSEARLALSSTGVEIRLNKTLIRTRQQAIDARFSSSPTIKVAGRDIAPAIDETGCKECGNLCGDDVNCRVWNFNGKQYLSPPKAMIIDAILAALYAPVPPVEIQKPFVLPDNLEKFFRGIESANHK